MIKLIHLSVEQILLFIGIAITSVFWKVMYVLIALAIFDFSYGKWQWLRHNKMTKDEVKDERKSIEGDEATKKKIQQKGFQRVIQRLNKTVPKANVIITNPTHFAVALQYDRKTMRAPIVVAKGQDFLALRIREIAREAGIPILERKALARALYASAEIGSEIPYELFKAVAEVLAYVFRLKNPHRTTQQSTTR
jgi:flagellar biosynthetic protein FlhB